MEDLYISHHGIIGMKWGIRRFRNEDGSLTEAGEKRYNKNSGKKKKQKKEKKTAISKYQKADGSLSETGKGVLFDSEGRLSKAGLRNFELIDKQYGTTEEQKLQYREYVRKKEQTKKSSGYRNRCCCCGNRSRRCHR